MVWGQFWTKYIKKSQTWLDEGKEWTHLKGTRNRINTEYDGEQSRNGVTMMSSFTADAND